MAHTPGTPAASPWGAMKAELKVQRNVLGGALALMWGVWAVNTVLGGALSSFGVHPRHVSSLLTGLVFAPLLHGGWEHLASNSVPFVALGWMVLLRGVRHFFWATLGGVVAGGLCAWLLGAPHSVHIGASGVVFAYLGFLMLGGWFERSLGTVLVSVAVAVLWGGLVFGVLPGQPGISWQAHLGGFVGGVWAARLTARRPQST